MISLGAAALGLLVILETSEELIGAREFGCIVGSLSERRLLAAVDAVLVALPPTSTFEVRPTPDERAAHRPEQRGVAIDSVHRYNPEAVIVVGVPFEHTRPQWIVTYGGQVAVDGGSQTLWADYA